MVKELLLLSLVFFLAGQVFFFFVFVGKYNLRSCSHAELKIMASLRYVSSHNNVLKLC